MRRLVLLLLAAPLLAQAQTFDGKDWQAVCDNTRTCRAAGYSADGSDAPVSVLLTRAAGGGAPVYVELQLGVLDARSVRPASVTLVVAGKPAGAIRVDRDNHAVLAGPTAAALLKAVVAGSPVAFTAGKSTWHLSNDGALDVLQKMDDVQGRSGRQSALVRRGAGSDADVASPMSVPRFGAQGVSMRPTPGDDALVLRIMASIPSDPGCPMLDDSQAQARARLWHLDANRLLVSAPCRAAEQGAGNGYWLANQRPPFDARPLTTTGGEFDGSSVTARTSQGTAGDCAVTQSWTWNGYRFDPSWTASGGLCRGVKAGGAWELPSLVSDVPPGK